LDPHENLPLATFLEKKATGNLLQAGLRGACGRAYYSAFGVIRDILDAAKMPIPHQGAHKRVLTLLSTSTSPDVLVARGLYRQLRETRDEADYDVGRRAKTPFDLKRSQRAIVLATTVISAMEQAATANPRLYIP